jgi:UDP-N-acetylmuramate--alanine ligase
MPIRQLPPLGILKLVVPGRTICRTRWRPWRWDWSWACRSTWPPGSSSRAERRFEIRGERKGILIVDDYGHHPTEIAAVIQAARAFNRRIVVAFQPHRFSRTAALMEAFGPSLAGADHIVLTDIYAAGEEPMPGVTIDALAASIRSSIRATVDVVPALGDVVPAVIRAAREGDLVITLGAGSIGTLPERLLAALEGQP